MLLDWFILAAFGGTSALLAALLKHLHAHRQIQRLESEHRERLRQLDSGHHSRMLRLEQEGKTTLKYAHHPFLQDLLPVLDALEEALHHVPRDSDDELQQGLKLVIKQCDSLLAKHEIVRIAPAQGEPFDPVSHEAVATIEHPELDSGVIYRCLRPGYRQDSRVLRSAMVEVVTRLDDSKDGHSPNVEAPADSTD